MNSFGRNFRVHIFGESHGPMVGITIDGCLPGIPISESDFADDLNRRKGGVSAGTTSRSEADTPIFLSGVFNGYTTGAPLTIAFENNNTQPKDYDAIRAIPRPGHADFVATKKFNGFEDYRGGGHFSGRLTVCLVAAGVVAKKMIEKISESTPIEISAEIIEVGGETDIEKAIETAIKNQDSIGGIIGCKVKNLPIGAGSPFFDSIESLISHAVFSIPAIKGIEFGSGFSAAKMKGSEHNDSIINEIGETSSNHAGGISGGLSNGNDIEFRVVVKPTSSTPKMQESYNIVTNKIEEFAIKGRHDLCIALRVPPVLEAVTALVVADLLMMG
jgi:chorismate synthase